MSAQPNQYPPDALHEPLSYLMEEAEALIARPTLSVVPSQLRSVPGLPAELLRQYDTLQYQAQHQSQLAGPLMPDQQPQPTGSNFLAEHPLFRRSLFTAFTGALLIGSVVYFGKSASGGTKIMPPETALAPEITPIQTAPSQPDKPSPTSTTVAKPHPTSKPVERPSLIPMPNQAPQVTYIHRDFSDPARGRELPTDIYLPPTSKPMPLVIFEPGQGHIRQPDPAKIDNYHRLLTNISSKGYVAFATQSPDYKQSLSNGLAKAQTLDIARVISLLMEDPQYKNRIDFSSIAILGNSSGGATAITAGFDPSVKIPTKLIMPLSGAIEGGAVGGYGSNVVSIAGTDDGINSEGATRYLGSLHPDSLHYILVKGMGHYKQLTNAGFISPIDGYNYTYTEDALILGALDQYVKGKAYALQRAVNMFGARVTVGS